MDLVVDDHSSQDGQSSVSTNHHAQEEEHARDHAQKKEELLAENEDMAVTWLRLVLLAVLVGSAVSVSLLVFLYTKDEEENDFEKVFLSSAQKILETVGANFDQTLGAADAFIFKMVSYVKYSNSTFPFVTMPDFGVQAAKVISHSDAFYVGFNPLVTADQRSEWESYTSRNKGWVTEHLDIQSRDPNYFGQVEGDYDFLDYIFDSNAELVPYDHKGPFQPNWQAYPTVPFDFPSYNWNSLSDPDYAAQIQYSMDTKQVVVTSVFNLVDDPNDEEAVAFADFASDWAKSFVPKDEDTSEPMSDWFYPVVGSIGDVKLDINNEGLGPSVGVLLFTLFWRDTIRDILPTGTNGVIVVFSNSCDQVFSYRVDGADATYLGPGDHHNSKYDYLGKSALLTELSGRDTKYTGLPMDTENCLMGMRLYPSQDMEDDYLGSDPLIFCLSAALIFVFTSALFLLYDGFVARRQRIVKQRAIASGAIVNSLFPEKVRNQLYKENEENNNKDTQQADTFLAKNVMASDTTGDGGAGNTKPIADLFEETTIFFADLAGFTQWSSSRSPVEVFELLEALFGTFDAIAKRRKVFKVETIGDCYVAVTGIPDPQPNHSVIMVKFARECMNRMRYVINELADSLGEDTRELEMRIGLHSGSTTAGVLRGERGRFQLFGDTVNTASRMESTGVKGRIHVSQATADSLTALGKESWLIPREEKINAKGKGEMQTYFVAVKGQFCNSAASTTGLFESDVGNNAEIEEEEEDDSTGDLDDRIMSYLGRGFSEEVDA